jgi:D-alanyl-D-alanine carboxypeptidase (penicillin-binding protein 5/6)
MMNDQRRVFRRRDFLRVGGAGLLSIAWGKPSWGQAPAEAPLEARRPADALDGPPVVSARAWAVADGASGRFLWGANEATALTMASTTKIMTALLVLRAAADNPKVLDETLIVSEQAAATPGSGARLRAGERAAVRDMLFGLLLPSGNDAATALAEHFGARLREEKDPAAPLGAFVAAMNRQARTLHLAEMRYFDPHGLGKNQTSARNLAALAWQAMQNPLFRTYARTRRHTCELADAAGARRSVTWNNTNRLLEIEGYEGIKTGTTNAAGSCLVASGRRGCDHLLVVVLGCTSNDSRYVDARNLFRWAWRERGHRRS